MKTQSNANPMLRNPNPGEGQHPGPQPRSTEGTRLPHHISVATVTQHPMQRWQCQWRQEEWARCRWQQAPPAQLAFSGASLPEEAAQLYPPIKDFHCLTWHCRWILLCKNVHHYMRDYINLSCLSIPGASVVQAFPVMLLDIVKNYQLCCLRESFCIQHCYIAILPKLIN